MEKLKKNAAARTGIAASSAKRAKERERKSAGSRRAHIMDDGVAAAGPTLLFQTMSLLLLLLLGAGAGGASNAAITVKSYENDTVLLPCHVEDLGVQTRVRWYRAGQSSGSNILLADSDEPTVSTASQRVKMWGNRSLELVQVRPEDSGEYVCQASRPVPWGAVTQVYEIQVMYPASAKPIPESGQLEVVMGEEATMSCVSEGVPKPVLAWSFQGQELPILASGQRLRILANNRSLAGIYSCQASNGIGEPAKAVIELKIKHKPEVTAVTRWLHSAPEIRARLECLVVAYPEARLDWYLENEKVVRSQRVLRYKQDTSLEDGSAAQLHSLVIRSVQPRDLGHYSCRASNELGQSEASLELSGVAKPPLLKKEIRSSSSNSYNFIWEVDSYSPIVEYQFWFRQMDSREDWRRLFIPSGNEGAGPVYARSFNLTGLQASRQYEALVLARNRFGWSSPSRIIRFATGQPSAVQVTSDSQRSESSSGVWGSHHRNDSFVLWLSSFVVLILASGKIPLDGVS
ncbi:neurotrimin isoform X2 [Nasonia vitripennis]|uniref:Uncharacterized protein n=1 Tax=Nasonia vitripennis TaxID=7425 RepID=A0A7M7QLN4_NASVI|nr:neurotrimin isoform X2 [Nasonia vitripennis]